ncbi:MAG: carotenoid oxygenase family protein [Cyanobacteria bacterium P01_D01_bin.50]
MNHNKYQIPNSIMKASREEINELELAIFKQEGNELSLVENLPDGLSGYVFIAAPLPYGDGSFVLNGDGMIYRLDLTEGKAKLKTKIAKTPCYYADLAIQNQPNKYPNNFRFRNGGPSRMSQVLGSRNQLNTAFLKTSEQLFVTFDAARPYEIDPSSLEILEPIGSTNKWEQIFPLSNIFGTYSNPAHPVCDVQGLKSNNSKNEQKLFTINYSTGYKGNLKKLIGIIFKWIKQNFKGSPITKLLDSIQLGYTNLICYDLETKEFESWEMILPDGKTVSPDQTIHQMAITEDYIIFMDIAFKIELSQLFSPYWLEPIGKLKTIIINIFNILTILGLSVFDKYKDVVEDIFMQIGQWMYSKFLRLIPPEPYTNLYIVSRESLSKENKNSCDGVKEKQKSHGNQIKVKKVTIDREVSHFTVDYCNPDNKIILHVGHNNGSDVTEWIGKYDLPARKNKLRQELAGMIVGAMDLGCLGRYTIDGKTGIVRDERVISDPEKTWSISVCTYHELCNESINETADRVKNIYWMSWGFSWENIPQRIYSVYKDSKFRNLDCSELSEEDYKPVQLLRLDTEKMEIVDSFEFPYGHFACTPQFIPSSLPCPEDKDPSIHGYIVCVVLADNPDNSNEAQDEFWILHADDFNNKPVYRLRSPQLDLGLTIHSTWLQEIDKEKYSEEERRKKREVSVYEDYAKLIKKRPKIKELFEKFVYSNFIEQTPEAKVREQK